MDGRPLEGASEVGLGADHTPLLAQVHPLRLVGLSLADAQRMAAGAIGAERLRRMQVSMPRFKALRGLMADVLSPSAWLDDPVWDSVWQAAVPLRPREADRALHAGGDAPIVPDTTGAQLRALDLLDMPGTLSREGSVLFVSGVTGRFFERLQTVQRQSVAHGMWWPMPEGVQVLLSSDRHLGMRLRFPPGFERQGQTWFEYWRPAAGG